MLTVRSHEIIIKIANVWQDGPILAQIRNIDFLSKEVKYYNVCKMDHLNQARSIITEEQNSGAKINDAVAHE